MKFTGMSRTIRCLIAMMAVCLVMLCGIAVAESTSDFTISDSVLTKYNGSDQVVTVPDGVTSIGANAFSYSYSLSKITLPDTVTSIGDSAFGNCYSLPSIILPDGITSIGQEVFYDRITVYCNENTTTEQTLSEAGYSYQIYQPIALTYADNGDGTATITGLTGVGDELIIPSTVDGLKVTTIGKSAFRYNAELISVVIPEGVTKIESGAFNGCRLIQSMTLPSTLVTIEGSAFTNCYQIAELAIPAATTDIRSGAFWGSSISLKIDSANTAYKVVDDVLYTADLKTLKFCPINKMGVFAIPEGTEKIEASAFMACNDVTEVQIPASVTAIDGNVFYPMGMLKNFVVDEASQSYQTVDGMLLTKDGKLLIAGCDSLEGTVTIPDGVKEIGLRALMSGDITELVLPEGITTIEMLAVNASELEKVNLPGSLTSIDTDAFSGMRSSLVATVEDGSYAHQWCIDNDVTVEVVYPFTYTDNGDGTATITGYTGYNSTVEVPEELYGLTVTSIARNTFWPFEYDEETNQDIKAKEITSIILPSTLTTLESGALSGSDITEITLPAGMKTVTGTSFTGCSSLQKVNVEAGNTSFIAVNGVLYNAAGTELIKYPAGATAETFTVPSGVTAVKTFAFQGNQMLTHVTIPEGVSVIESWAFQRCSNLRTISLPDSLSEMGDSIFDQSGLVEIVLPKNLKILPAYAFYGCTSLQSVTFPDGMTSILADAFGACSALESLKLPDNIIMLDSNPFQNNLVLYCIPGTTTEATLKSAGIAYETYTPVVFTYTDNGDGTATITGCDNAGADLVIPTTIDGLKVTAIGAKAFRFNTEITSVVIPEGVTKIGSGAFNGCRNIQNVSLPSTLVTIESSAFTNCYQIAELAIPAATTDIRAGAFWGSSISLKIDSANTAYKVVDDVLYTADLKTLKFCPINKTGVFVIPEGTEKIEASAFMACNDVTEVQIPASVTAIDGNVFYPMGMLKNFVVDEASHSYQTVDGMLLTKDGKLLIAGCDSLEGTVTIPDGVKEIGLQALMSGDITELVLPEGITTIEMLAVNASELEKVNLPGSLTSIDSNAFSGMRSTLVATVEDGSYAHQWCIDNDVTVEVVSKTTDPAAFTYTDNGDGTCTITGYTGTAAEVIIPAKMDGLTVTVIGMGAFERNETIISVDIPEGVTHIETGVFYLCPNLQSVRLPESLTSIDSAAFGFCSSLTELTIPAAATSIGAAFYGMPTIITVDSANTAYKTVDDVLYTIDGKTLMFCPSTKSGVFSVPEGTETIGYSAFFACEYLTEIRIPASIKTISSTDFYKTSSLTGFVVDEKNTAYKAVNGMLLSKDGTQLYTIPQAFSGKVTIPDGVTTICCDALRESQPGITELVLPDSVTTIESIAISHSALEKINLPAGLTSMGYNAINNRSENLVATVEDGSYAHQWCIENGVKVEVTSKPTDPAFFTYTDNGDGSVTITGYTGGDSNVVIPSSVYGLQVKAIASNAFANNKTIISVAVPEGITSIGSYAFMQCSSLESIALPKSLRTIEQFAFVGCASLKGLFIPEGVTTISWGMLTECSSLESLFLPSTLEEVVTSYAFYKCSSLTAFELAEGNTTFSVVDGVLFNKAGTELVAYPGGKSGHYDIPAGVTLIGDFAFAGVTNPISVTVPVGVTTIEENAFATCSGLKNITLPEGLTSIGNAAFSNCSGLEKISLPSTVELYAGVVFSNCSSMTAYEVASGNSTLSAKDGVLFNKAGTELIAYPGAIGGHYEVPAGVTTLGQSAFSGADKLTSLTIPNGVTTIYANTFRGCSSLEQIDLPQTITALHYSMFEDCTSLKSVVLPDNISTIGNYVFADETTIFCRANTVTAATLTKAGYSYELLSPFTYTDNGDGTAAITGYTGTSAAVTIPASIDGLNVTAIGDSAFENNTIITSVIIPEGVTSIGQYAFWQCGTLKSVSLPETLTTIEDYAFSFCSNLTELRIPAVATSIGSAFYGMPTIITVDSANTAYKTVDDVLYTIDGKTLMFCPRIKEGAFSIPQGTETIGDGAFFACWNLTEISIPASVTTIPGDAFGEANKLTGFVVDENNSAYKAVNGMLLSKDGTLLHTVPMTFSGTVTVPEGVTTIGSCAFRGSWPAGVTEIVLPDSVAVLEHEAFLNQTALEKINLPASLTSISDGAFYNLNSECVATVYENTLAHHWCVEKGIKVNVLESDGLIFPVAASRLCTNPETPAGCYFASVQKNSGELRLQFDNDACLWDDLVTSAVYEDGTMMLPVDVLRLSGAAAYRWMEGDPESETILDQLAQASAQTLGEYDEQIYLSIPYAQYDEANQTVSPVASENAFLIQWLDGNGEIMLTESVTMIITHSDLSNRSAQIRYFDMSTAIPNYHNVEGVTSRVENNTLIYSVPADYEELISTRYPAIEGAAFARPTCFGWSARLPLSDGNTYWSWRMSGVELPFVDESAILWFDENDHYLGCERISVRYEVKAEEQLIPSMPASRIFPDDLPFGMEATVTVADGKFGVHIDDEATNWNDVFTFLEGMPWHNPDTGESGVWSDEVMIGARMTDLDGAVYSKSVVGNVWENDEEILASLESSDDVQDLTTYGHGWWHDVVVLDRDSGSISLSEIIRDPDFGGDYTYAVQWFDADMNVIATEKVVFEITHTNPDKTYNYSRTLIPAENIVANVENASGVTSTVKDGSVSYKQIAEDAVIVTEIIAPENAVTYSAPGEYFDSDAERWPVDNGKIGYVREGVLMDTVTASDFICWYDADGELIGGGWIDFCYERGEESAIVPMAAERIAVQGGAFGLEVDVEITDGMMHAVFDDEATNWNDVFTFLEPTPWYNPETSEKGVRFGAYFYIPEGAAYAKHIVVETEDTDEEILAYLAEETELATLNANMRFGSYYFPAELNNGVITLNDYHTNVQVFQWLDENQNVLFTEKAVLCFEHTNPNQTYNYSRTLIPAQNIVGNVENMPGVTWKAADGLIVTTVEDKQITTTTEIIAPENAATYSMPELDTNGERWPLNNGRVGFQRVGWPSTENQTSTEYLLCWYDADGDLIGGGWITMTDVCPIPETVLPAFTKEIAEEAFAGSGVQRVIIPDGCTTIGARAFANCASLTEVHIPASVTSIAEDTFVGCPNLMIYAPIPSTGADFASDHDIKWANVSSFH